MHARTAFAACSGFALLVLVGSAASAAPKTYVFSGKLTSNRGPAINVPMVGNVPCSGVGLANLTVMSGPGAKAVPSPYTQPTHSMTNLANPFGCVGHVSGRKLTTTGAGAGGAFVMPAGVFAKSSGTAVVIWNATPIRQIFTSFRVTGPRSAKAITGASGSKGMTFPAAAFHAFKKGAWMTQTGRQGSMFTWCWGNPNCAKITQGSQPLIVKYHGGGNAFGGTMGYVVSSGPSPSNLAVAVGANGPVGFAILPTRGSQPTGRGYAVSRTDVGTPGPVWGAHKESAGGRITMVSLYIGMSFPTVYAYNFGFPWTTGTVLARNTGTFAGNPQVATLTAKGGDTVTAMGQRNLSLVAGGVARSNMFPNPFNPFSSTYSSVPEIGQMYLPEPGGAASLAAGAVGLLVVAAARRRR